MAIGRPSKPLFELLREESTTGRRPAQEATPHAENAASTSTEMRPETRIDPKPMSRGGRAARRDARADIDQPGTIGSPTTWAGLAGSTVTLSKAALAIAAAVVLLLIFSMYALGYSSGRKQGQRDMSSALPGEKLDIKDPTSTNPTPVKQAVASEQPNNAPSAASNPSGARSAGGKRSSPEPKPILATDTNKSGSIVGQTSPDDGTKPVILSTGPADADPRTPGMNYLVLATMMSRDEARELVGFLSKNGMEAAAVYVPPRDPAKSVDQDGRGGNNRALFKVVAVTGVTKEQYKSNDPARQSLNSESRRIGALWQKTKVGRSDLSKTYWESLVGDDR